ncbi:MAG: hypothetical protein EA426_16865 [Spirochaetaceae bacterium]|nr:MAG: hypothetical protein EA426_16865 [Spirochaetaceae bacterium]
MKIDTIILLSGIGFSILLVGDLLQLLKRPRGAFPIVIIGYIVILLSLFFLVVGAGTPAVSPFGIGVAALASTPAVFLLWRSLFAEVKSSGSSSGTRRVTSTGTYSICRHPGFLWLTWLLVILVLVYRTPTVAMGVAWITALNLALVKIEDAFIFPRIFSDYEDYKRRVAFLLPCRKGS